MSFADGLICAWQTQILNTKTWIFFFANCICVFQTETKKHVLNLHSLFDCRLDDACLWISEYV